MTPPLVLKVGGELLEQPSRMAAVVAAIGDIVGAPGKVPLVPLVIVHGGGKEIDAALKTAGIDKRQVEGLRITDDATLVIVVAVLAGAVNTRFVAALGAAGVSAVGLTGADGGCGLSDLAPPHITVDGQTVYLGRVGHPAELADMHLLNALLRDGFVPVVASIGVDRGGQLLNVNADTMAGQLAANLGARRLVIAGSTPGVLDDNGATVAVLDPAAMARLVSGGTATAGMIAKLRACKHALSHGVDEVVIVDGRDRDALCAAASGVVPASATRVATTVGTRS